MWIAYKIDENDVEVLPLLKENYLRMLHNYAWNGGFIVYTGSADRQSDQDYVYFFHYKFQSRFFGQSSHTAGFALPSFKKIFVILSSSIFPLALQSSLSFSWPTMKS